MPLFNNLPPEPSLLTLNMPAGNFPGYTVAFTGWTGNENITPFWIRKGFGGVHIIGKGPDKTIYRSMTSESTLIFGRRCGYVKIENVTIKTGYAAGKQKAIFGGIDSANAIDLVPYTIHLKNCVIETAPTVDPDKHPEWPIFIDQGDIILENCIIRSTNSNEHALYVHGFGQYGAYIINTTIDGVGAEGLKFTARPQARYYADPNILQYAKSAYSDGYHPIAQDNWIVVRGCTIRDWDQPWSWRGGAGMTVQGAGLKVLLEDSNLYDFHETKPAFAMDDGGVEHFGENNVAGVNPANGELIVRRCIMNTGPGPSWYSNTFRVGAELNNSPVIVTPSVTVEDCGIYGDHMLLSIGGTNSLNVKGCNTPEINARAALLGIDTSKEVNINYKGYFGLISRGYSS